MTYQEKKERIRAIAIAWSNYDCCHSFGECVDMQAFFQKYGEKYGLLEEFDEEFIPF